MEIEIGLLKMTVANVAGQEHRMQPIAERAGAIFTEHLDGDPYNRIQGNALRSLDALYGESLTLNIGQMTNEQIANRIAKAWIEALELKLR